LTFEVERVDFVSFLTQDIPRAKQFYSETLGLEIETKGEKMSSVTWPARNSMFTTDVCKQAWFKDPDGNALMLHRRFDA
jgi:hypothetical protein